MSKEDYFIKSVIATVREITKTTFIGSKSFNESKNNIDDISNIIGKIIFNDKNIFNKKKKNKLKRIFINMTINMFVGVTKMVNRIIVIRKINKNTILFTKISLATIISINYNDNL